MHVSIPSDFFFRRSPGADRHAVCANAGSSDADCRTDARRGRRRSEGRPARRALEVRRRQGRRVDERLHAADGRLHLQFCRARLPGNRDEPVSHRCPQEERFQRAGGDCRHSDGVHGDVGIGQAGHRARFRHRRHSAGVAEAGRCLPRADDRGRTGARRGPQFGPGREHHCRDRREEDHGAREAARNHSHLARYRGGARRDQGVLRARWLLQGC